MPTPIMSEEEYYKDQEAREALKRRASNERIKTFTRGTEKVSGGIEKAGGGLLSRLGHAALSAGGKALGGMRGLKTEDQIVHKKGLYFMGRGLNPRLTPLGQPFDRSNPWTLYGFNRNKMPEGAGVVYQAMQQGYTIEQLQFVTNLSPSEIASSISFLKRNKMWEQEWD